VGTHVLTAAGVIQFAALGHCVLLQCTIHKNLHVNNAATRFDQPLIMVPAEVIFRELNCLAHRCRSKALGTLVLTAAGRGVIQFAVRNHRAPTAVHHHSLVSTANHGA
jgi:hypothetical protein